ncbi:hypothetical protein ACP275_03G033900 [Erythranthe tilingii]
MRGGDWAEALVMPEQRRGGLGGARRRERGATQAMLRGENEGQRWRRYARRERGAAQSVLGSRRREQGAGLVEEIRDFIQRKEWLVVEEMRDCRGGERLMREERMRKRVMQLGFRIHI